uniref:Uncharacterized protein n=1 Tax=Cucumis melo TaxID=3656 RepID=A0A9I9E3Y2_CUCME
MVTETEEEGEISAAGGWKRIGNGWRPRRNRFDVRGQRRRRRR